MRKNHYYHYIIQSSHLDNRGLEIRGSGFGQVVLMDFYSSCTSGNCGHYIPGKKTKQSNYTYKPAEGKQG